MDGLKTWFCYESNYCCAALVNPVGCQLAIGGRAILPFNSGMAYTDSF